LPGRRLLPPQLQRTRPRRRGTLFGRSEGVVAVGCVLAINRVDSSCHITHGSDNLVFNSYS
jgi:hypothetical protein